VARYRHSVRASPSLPRNRGLQPAISTLLFLFAAAAVFLEYRTCAAAVVTYGAAALRLIPVWSIYDQRVDRPVRRIAANLRPSGGDGHICLTLSGGGPPRRTFMSETKFLCSGCGQKIQCDDQYAGQQILCPACQATITVPQPPPVPIKIQQATAPPPPALPSVRPVAAASPARSASGKTWIVTGLFLMVGLAFLLNSFLLKPLSKVKAKAQNQICQNRLMALWTAARFYSVNGIDQLPMKESWCDAIKTGVAGANGYESNPGRAYQCPDGSSDKPCHYAFNAKLSGLQWSKVNPNAVVFFETSGGWNVSGGAELMLVHSRHDGSFMILFADGHVGQLAASQFQNLRWEP